MENPLGEAGHVGVAMAICGHCKTHIICCASDLTAPNVVTVLIVLGEKDVCVISDCSRTVEKTTLQIRTTNRSQYRETNCRSIRNCVVTICDCEGQVISISGVLRQVVVRG